MKEVNPDDRVQREDDWRSSYVNDLGLDQDYGELLNDKELLELAELVNTRTHELEERHKYDYVGYGCDQLGGGLRLPDVLSEFVKDTVAIAYMAGLESADTQKLEPKTAE